MSSRKKVLEHLAEILASELVSGDVTLADAADLLLEGFTAREKLGSTALENGIAVPHCRDANCKQPIAAVVTLTDGVDYDARDGKPVDVFFALVVPIEATDEHLEILASIVSLLSDTDTLTFLRQANSSLDVYQRISA